MRVGADRDWRIGVEICGRQLARRLPMVPVHTAPEIKNKKRSPGTPFCILSINETRIYRGNNSNRERSTPRVG